MELSVVILNYNVKHFLFLCLQSVYDAISDLKAEVIVVDNNSQDESQSYIKAHFPEVIWIQNQENLGFSKANNIAVAQSKGEYVCVLNPDTVVPEHVFLELLTFAKTKEKLGIVGCQLVDGSGHFLPESKRNVPTPVVALQKIIGKTEAYYATHINKNAISKVSVFVGAFMLLKKSVYTKVGGFDERYFMYGEDIDLSYKVEKAGYNNYYYGKVKVLHFKGESTLRDKTHAKRFFGAMNIFYKTHFKKNVFLDIAVAIGTKIMMMIPKKKVVLGKVSKPYILISSKLFPELQVALKENLLVKKDLNDNKGNVTYILDANHLGFKKLVSIMSSVNQNGSNSFRILPKNANFIIGSDSTLRKGEIIQFKTENN